MKQEKAFFETMAGALSPGWSVKLQSHLQPGQMDLGRYQVRLYLIDTSNGWTAAAAMAPEGFAEASQNVAAAGLTSTFVLDAAGEAIAQLSRRQALGCRQLLSRPRSAHRRTGGEPDHQPYYGLYRALTPGHQGP